MTPNLMWVALNHRRENVDYTALCLITKKKIEKADIAFVLQRVPINESLVEIVYCIDTYIEKNQKILNTSPCCAFYWMIIITFLVLVPYF